MTKHTMKWIDRVHLRMLKYALKKTEFNTMKTAELLGVSVRTVNNWKYYYGLLGREKLPTKRMMK